MTTWSKTPPSEPGWYWIMLQTPFPLLLQEDGVWDPGEQETEELLRDGARFGPRIPSPEAIEAAKDALREAAQRAERTEGEDRLAAIYRAAFAKLEGRS